MRSYSVREAAAELGVSANLVYGLCQRGRIRHERHGLGRGTIRIPEDALEEYRRSVTVGTEKARKGPPAPQTAETPRRTGGFTILDADRLRNVWADRNATASRGDE
jgi:excisionase family DNA binding protein